MPERGQMEPVRQDPPARGADGKVGAVNAGILQAVVAALVAWRRAQAGMATSGLRQRCEGSDSSVLPLKRDTPVFGGPQTCEVAVIERFGVTAPPDAELCS